VRFGSFADQGDESLLALHVDELVVDTGFDKDHPPFPGRRALRKRVDRFLNGPELTTPIGGDDRVCGRREISPGPLARQRRRPGQHRRRGGDAWDAPLPASVHLR
jgi:hypothetical protein